MESKKPLSLPQETLDKIYGYVFEDVLLSPTYNRDVETMETPHLGLLLMCKRQYAAVEGALWKYATVYLGIPDDITWLVHRHQHNARIRHLKLFVPTPEYCYHGVNINSLPFLLMSRLLGQLTGLVRLHLDVVTVEFPGKYGNLEHLLATNDSLFQYCLHYLLLERFEHAPDEKQSSWWLRYVWVESLLDNVSLQREGELANIFISFSVVPKFDQSRWASLDREDLDPTGPISGLFDASKRCVTFISKEKQFIVPQIPVDESAVDRRDHRALPRYGHISGDLREHEQATWDIYNQVFAGEEPNLSQLGRLYRNMDIVNRSGKKGFIRRAWNLAQNMLDEPEDEPFAEYPPEGQHRIWSRILGINDPQLPARPWRWAYDLLKERMEEFDPYHGDRREADEPLMDYRTQWRFFTGLWGLDEEALKVIDGCKADEEEDASNEAEDASDEEEEASDENFE